MLQGFRERLTVLLLALLPLHAFLVTVGTRILKGPMQAPWTPFALWKEALLAFILVLAGVEILMSLKNKKRRRATFSLDLLDGLMLILFVLALVITEHMHGDWQLFAYGAKYDFIPLIAFAVLRRCKWSKEFLASLKKWIPLVGVGISIWALIALTLPYDFFVWLGYSDMHSLFFPGKPIAAFQYVSEVPLRRAQATMSGPNQYGIWLLIPLSFLLIKLLTKKEVKNWWQKALTFLHLKKRAGNRRYFIFLVIIVLGLLASFSRTAWIGAFVLTVTACVLCCERKQLRTLVTRGVISCAFLGVIAGILFPEVILRISSSRGHFVRPLEGIARMIETPLGEGLGTAGPASARRSDTCVHLRPQDDPSWARGRRDLCVFLGTQQVQPVTRKCNCPFHPENWYVQIGVELGWIGFFLYLALMFLIARGLYLQRTHPLGTAVFLAFIGISVCGLLQHSWEDAAVAYTVWAMGAVVLQKK